jgi:hypothetical protein
VLVHVLEMTTPHSLVCVLSICDIQLRVATPQSEHTSHTAKLARPRHTSSISHVSAAQHCDTGQTHAGDSQHERKCTPVIILHVLAPVQFYHKKTCVSHLGCKRVSLAPWPMAGECAVVLPSACVGCGW